MVNPTQARALLGSLATPRSPARDRVLLLLSMKAGLQAKELASVTWAMVTDATGHVAEAIHVPNRARKGKTGEGDTGKSYYQYRCWRMCPLVDFLPMDVSNDRSPWYSGGAWGRLVQKT
jgi:hypothetical protein